MARTSELSEQNEIDDFVRGKTTRQVAIIGLSMTNAHIKECAERWEKIVMILKWIGYGIGVLVLSKLIDETHAGPIHDAMVAIKTAIAP